MLFYGEIEAKPGASYKAFSYDPVSKTISITNSLVQFERVVGDYWAIKIQGDYSMIFDADGLLIGDFGLPGSDYPRVNIVTCKCGGIYERIASLSKNGFLMVNDVKEVADATFFPAGSLNILDQVAFSPAGLFTTKVNEVWFLTDNDGNYVCSNGQLIQVNP